MDNCKALRSGLEVRPGPVVGRPQTPSRVAELEEELARRLASEKVLLDNGNQLIEAIDEVAEMLERTADGPDEAVTFYDEHSDVEAVRMYCGPSTESLRSLAAASRNMSQILRERPDEAMATPEMMTPHHRGFKEYVSWLARSFRQFLRQLE